MDRFTLLAHCGLYRRPILCSVHLQIHFVNENICVLISDTRLHQVVSSRRNLNMGSKSSITTKSKWLNCTIAIWRFILLIEPVLLEVMGHKVLHFTVFNMILRIFACVESFVILKSTSRTILELAEDISYVALLGSEFGSCLTVLVRNWYMAWTEYLPFCKRYFETHFFFKTPFLL